MNNSPGFGVVLPGNFVGGRRLIRGAYFCSDRSPIRGFNCDNPFGRRIDSVRFTEKARRSIPETRISALSLQTPFPRLPLDTKRLSFSERFTKNKVRPKLGRLQNSKKMLDFSRPELLLFEKEEELSDSLANFTVDLSQRFTQERGAFSVVVSGGSLIKSLRKLAESPFVESVDWSKWHFFWVDERVVPKNHPDSNFKLAYDEFLSKVPIPPGQIYAINDTLSAEDAADDYEACLRQLVNRNIIAMGPTGFPKFDLMLIGMGPDGHVASLFPNHPLLEENSRWVAFIKESPKPPPERITFTFPVINSSANIALVATGSGKAGPVGRAFGTGSSSDKLPIQMVSPFDGRLIWFTDKDASSLI